MPETKPLFGKPKAEPAKPQPIDSSSLANLNRRIRMLEERVFTIQKKQQVVEENLISANKSFSSEIKLLNQELAEEKQNFREVKERLERLGEKLDTKANEAEFLVFKKYLELWRPVTFVTEGEVRRIINEELSKALERIQKGANRKV